MLVDDFRALLMAGTGRCAIRTPDYRRTIETLLTDMRDYTAGGRKREEPQPATATTWNCASGLITPWETAKGEELCRKAEDISTDDNDPAAVIKNAINVLQADTIFFFIVPNDEILLNPFIAQAIANAREPFKATGRVLVLLGPDIKLPGLIMGDTPILDDPLPTVDELVPVVETITSIKSEMFASDGGKSLDLTSEEIRRAAGICLGMNHFAAEDAIARVVTEKGIDIPGLKRLRKSSIEESSGSSLKLREAGLSFKNLGGGDGWKKLMLQIAKGPKSPSAVVFADELDKDISASVGSNGDNTGVSQAILGQFVKAMENNRWNGILNIGSPGTGKTLSAECLAGELDIMFIELNMSALKTKELGESERNWRTALDIIKTVGGANVLWHATANRLETIPGELLRRFKLGTWFWDIPTEEDRRKIWDILLKQYGLNAKQPKPPDEGWTGSDIRDCVEMAWQCNSTLVDAASNISIAGVINRVLIEKLRDEAQIKGYRCARNSGAYIRPEKRQPKAARKFNSGNN